jgi:hypothetical protein
MTMSRDVCIHVLVAPCLYGSRMLRFGPMLIALRNCLEFSPNNARLSVSVCW